MAKVRMS